ncbi:hypothetical protein JTE90_025525 [Oedothorax gibbosus]|uniref:Uncharacterized protein n=1 Tax=Oedothorax gibbosus TaxID=931172 RepID=A0AAV6TVD4_9ARAC|nr:hypothetical protein JTE90_025525 [Oedothorax gibbosus]
MASDSDETIFADSEEELLSSESEESESEDFSYVRQWCRINADSPSPPRFPFTGSPGLKIPIYDVNNSQ